MAFADPTHVLAQIDIPIGGVVADFGAGAGYVAVAAAERVGKDGTVYIVDIQRDLLTKVTHLAGERHIDTFEYIHADLESKKGTSIPEGTVSVVIISNLLFQVDDKRAVLSEAARILTSAGQLLLVDWKDSFGGIGPHADAVFSEQAAEELVLTLGFEVVSHIDAGDYHYGLLCRKSS